MRIKTNVFHSEGGVLVSAWVYLPELHDVLEVRRQSGFSEFQQGLDLARCTRDVLEQLHNHPLGVQ